MSDSQISYSGLFTLMVYPHWWDPGTNRLYDTVYKFSRYTFSGTGVEPIVPCCSVPRPSVALMLVLLIKVGLQPNDGVNHWRINYSVINDTGVGAALIYVMQWRIQGGTPYGPKFS